MIINPKELLLDAEKHNYCIAGINSPSFEALQAIIEAAEELDAPLMISHAQSHEPYAPIKTFGPLYVELAQKTKVPVIIHLDHGMDMGYIMKAIRNGFTSIMYDCAHLPFEENARRVKEFTELAHSLDIIVEAEVGQMPSNIVGQGGCTEFGVGIENIEQYYTKPDEAAEFVRQTNVDMLAVSFGTVHGLFVEKPNLDINLLRRLHNTITCSLVMHGSTGVDDDQVVEAINNGMRKANFYTGMGIAPSHDVAELIQNAQEPVYFHEIAKLGKDIMKEKAKKQILLLQNLKNRT